MCAAADAISITTKMIEDTIIAIGTIRITTITIAITMIMTAIDLVDC